MQHRVLLRQIGSLTEKIAISQLLKQLQNAIYIVVNLNAGRQRSDSPLLDDRIYASKDTGTEKVTL